MRSNLVPTVVLSVTALAAGLGLTACSSSSDAGSSAASATESMVGGMTECTTAALQPAVDASATELGADNQMTIDDLQCADGWAVASGILGPKDAPSDGPQGAPTSFIFEQEGQFWVPKAAADVCGTSEADAEIPAALYTAGCAAG